MAIHVDDALQQLRDVCKNYEFVEKEITNNRIIANAIYNGVSVEIGFLNEKQSFFLTFLQGGMKFFSSIEDFERLFKPYIYLYAVVVPMGKHLVTYFEEDYNIQTVFKDVRGSLDTGYKAVFSIVGTDNELEVSEVSDCVFRCDYIVYNDDKSGNYLLDARLYDDNYEEIVTQDFYNEIVLLKCKDNANLTLNRIQDGKFRLSGAGTTCIVEFIVSNSQVDVNIHEAISDGVELKIDGTLIFELKDWFDLMEIIRRVEAYKQDQEKNNDENASNLFENSSDLNEEQENTPECSDNEEIVENSNNDFVSEEDAVEKVDSVNEEDTVEKVDSTSEEVPINEENTNEEEFSGEEESSDSCNSTNSDVATSDTSENCDLKDDCTSSHNLESSDYEFELYAILDENSEVIGVLIRNDKELYSVSLQVAEELCIPVKRLVSKTNLVNFRGIKVTEVEKKYHTFAIDLNDNKSKAEMLLDIFFDV